eukprot:9825546-Alexandrium_andersonii.AAC.1
MLPLVRTGAQGTRTPGARGIRGFPATDARAMRGHQAILAWTVLWVPLGSPSRLCGESGF